MNVVTALPRTCREALDTAHALIDFATVRTPRDLCLPIAFWRGRPIQVAIWPLPPAIRSVWFDMIVPGEGRGIDIILLADYVTEHEQDHALLHEVAHMLLGHAAFAGQAKVEQMFYFTTPDRLFAGSAAQHHAANRHPGFTAHERDAETVATALEREIKHACRFLPAPVPPGRANDNHPVW